MSETLLTDEDVLISLKLCGVSTAGTPAERAERLASHPDCLPVRNVMESVLDKPAQTALTTLPKDVLVSVLAGQGVAVDETKSVPEIVDSLKYTRRLSKVGALIALLLWAVLWGSVGQWERVMLADLSDEPVTSLERKRLERVLEDVRGVKNVVSRPLPALGFTASTMAPFTLIGLFIDKVWPKL